MQEVAREAVQLYIENKSKRELLDDVLDGGVNDSLNLDSHGKALSYLLLDMPVTVPAHLAPHFGCPTS